jgi:hypothetical protein
MNIRETVINTGKYLLAGLFVLMLTACHEDIALLDQGGALVGKGTVEVRANSASSVNLTVNRKEFSGTWKTTKTYDQNDEKRYKLMGSRSYERYFSGNARRVLQRTHVELTAKDGEEMKCDFYYHRLPGVGTCSIGEKSITVAIQQIEVGVEQPMAELQQKNYQAAQPEVMKSSSNSM